ncbi:MAG: glycosyl hydrolase family 28 protein [bacterium]|nr:glycosyl hydrolase family 28 protein [bacterium]
MNSVVTYQYAATVARAPHVRVTLAGQPVEVLDAEGATFAVVACAGTVAVQIVVDAPIQAAVVRPLRLGIAPQIADATLSFSLVAPAQVSVEIAGRPPLYLFVNPPEEDVPAPDAPGVRYFAGGLVHEAGEIVLHDHETLYIAGGAVVRGWLRATDAHNVRVCGHGILDGSFFPRESGHHHLCLLEHCTNVRVEDVVLLRPLTWTLVCGACEDVQVRNIKTITAHGGNDGIDLVSCARVLVEDCFLHAGDDCIAIKAFGHYAERGWRTDVEQIEVRGCVFLAHGANALEIGHELRTASVRDVLFHDCDILCVHGSGAAFSIHNGGRATIERVRYENMRIEHYYTFLFDLRILESRFSQCPQRGQIRDVLFKNLRITQSIFNPGYSVSLIGGYDTGHTIARVTFDGVFLDTRHVTIADQLDIFTRHAHQVVFH